MTSRPGLRPAWTRLRDRLRERAWNMQTSLPEPGYPHPANRFDVAGEILDEAAQPGQEPEPEDEAP